MHSISDPFNRRSSMQTSLQCSCNIARKHRKVRKLVSSCTAVTSVPLLTLHTDAAYFSFFVC